MLGRFGPITGCGLRSAYAGPALVSLTGERSCGGPWRQGFAVPTIRCVGHPLSGIADNFNLRLSADDPKRLFA